MFKNIEVNQELLDYISEFGYQQDPIQKEIIQYNKSLRNQERLQLSVTQANLLQMIISFCKIAFMIIPNLSNDEGTFWCVFAPNLHLIQVTIKIRRSFSNGCKAIIALYNPIQGWSIIDKFSFGNPNRLITRTNQQTACRLTINPTWLTANRGLGKPIIHG